MELMMTMQLSHNIAFTILAAQTNSALCELTYVTRRPHGEFPQSQISKKLIDKLIDVSMKFWPA